MESRVEDDNEDHSRVFGGVRPSVHSKRILPKMVQNLQRQMNQGLLN